MLAFQNHRWPTVTPPGNTVGLPTGAWLEGDSYSGHLNTGLDRAGWDYDKAHTGIGGSTMTDAVARVGSNQATYADDVLIFWDGIYEDYTDLATALSNIDDIATNAGSTPWVYIPPIVPERLGPEDTGQPRADNIRAISTAVLSGAYADNVVDIWPLLEALAIQGDADDASDISAGFLPRSIYQADGLHLTEAAIDAIAPAVIEMVKSKWDQVPAYDPSGTIQSILGGNLLTLVDPSAGGMLQTTGGAAVAADGDPIQVMPDQAGGGDFTNASAALRPTYRTDGTLHWIEARDSYLQKALSRSGDIYVCGAMQFPNASTVNHVLAVFYNDPAFYQGNYYKIQRDPFADPDVGHQLETNSGRWLTGESNTTEIVVFELIVTATDRTFVIHREEHLPETTTMAEAVALQSTTNLSLFGQDSDSIEGSGDTDTYLLAAANIVPSAGQRDNIVGRMAQAANLSLIPPQ